MKLSNRLSFSCRSRAAPQRGAVLIVAMIVLVALGLASLALLRSVDVLGLISGNLSLQRSSLTATDIGVNKAIVDVSKVALLTNADTDNCYSEVVLPSNKFGIPDLLADDLTAFKATYKNCRQQTTTGETIYRLVDRQCSQSLIPDPKACVLAQREPGGCDQHCFDKARIQPTYRVTVRVDGVKNTRSYSQMILK
jgi:type IV pilus assembly protein PilX